MITNETSDRLLATVKPWRDRLHGLDDSTIRHRPTPDRWTISEVIGHLVDSAANNHQRFVRAQEEPTLSFPVYDQNAWAQAANYADSEWSNLVDLWYCYNIQLAALIRNIPEATLATTCTIGDYEPCTLEFLIVDYVDHLQHHLTKIEERLN